MCRTIGISAALACVFLVTSHTVEARGGRAASRRISLAQLEDLLTTPAAYTEKQVSFECYFAKMGSFYRPFYTPFVRDHFFNFHVWPLNAELWDEDEQRKNLFLCLYILRSAQDTAKVIEGVHQYSVLRVQGVVRMTHGNLPWIQVEHVEALQDRLHYTHRGLQHMALGLKLADRTEWAMAVDSLETALEENLPELAETLVQSRLGEAYFSLNEYARAAAAISRAIELGESGAKLHMRLGQCYVKLGAKDEEKYTLAVEELRKAVDLQPGVAEARAALGLAYAYYGEYREGLRECDIAYKLQPTAEVLRTKGVIYHLRRDLRSAIKMYEKAIIIKANEPIYHDELADIFMEKQDYVSAEREYKNVIVLSPESPLAYVKRARARLRQATPAGLKGAIGDYKSAIEVDGDFVVAYVELAEIFRGQKQYNAAKVTFEKALEVDSASIAAYTGVARVCEDTNDLRGAAHAYARVVEIDPRNVDAYVKMALVLWRSKAYEEAKDSIQSAIDLNPANARIRFHMGRFYSATGDFKRASLELARAKGLDPSFLPARSEYARTLAQMGRTATAMSEYRAVLASDPENPLANSSLAYLIAEAGIGRGRDMSEAERLARKALTAVPTNADFKDAFGLVMYAKEDVETARKVFEESLKSSPGNPKLLYHTALLAGEQYGNWQAASTYLENAAKALRGLTANGAGEQVLYDQITRLRRRAAVEIKRMPAGG